MQILKGYTKENPYVVDDYPYGFKLRCKIKYWLEYSPNKGVRFVFQTSNPKRDNLVWNKPKASTYSRFGAAMYLDHNGHVAFAGLGEYSDLKEALAFKENFGEGVPEEAKKTLDDWIKAKTIYEEKLSKGIDYRIAGHETVMEMNKI